MRKEKKIDEHFILACSRGAYQNICSEKVMGALIGVGVLKGMNMVVITCMRLVLSSVIGHEVNPTDMTT